MTIHLERLEKVELREFFKDEARDFTPWLVEENNLELLGETLGLDIELEDTEVRIGKFSADIVGLDRSSNRTIIIENQLEKTNHDHLGKIITYSGGKDAGIVIWICKKIQQEHRKGLDYLNDISTEDYSFFGIEMELWRIGQSTPAPKFNIVVSPNEWSKSVKSATSSSTTLTDTKILQREFWTELKEYFTDNNTFLSMRTPRPQHWYSFGIGHSFFSIGLTINTRTNKMGCELYVRGVKAKKSFNELYEDKDRIETELGFQLDWQELPQGQDCRIIYYTDGDIRDRENWEKSFEWMKDKTESFHKVFSPRVKQL
ncbi:MAG: DUF4268 domain-containing protein [Candidatus Marinimicrobia bacterium]|nr:DUF4268 domain-containing protein [Candidatus Neomarinimicrobiota bacterium]